MPDIKQIQIAKRKQESREISKQIIDFGVKEDQKIDIMFNIAMTLENNDAMQEITAILKKFRKNINNTSSEVNNVTKSKILL